MKAIEQVYLIKAPIDVVWDALTNANTINKWGGGPAAIMDDQVGSDFSLWDGTIYGKNTKVNKNKLLEQDWYSSDKWKEPSKVIISLSPKSSYTDVKLIHSNIPDSDAADIEIGWKTYYLGPLKELLER